MTVDSLIFLFWAILLPRFHHRSSQSQSHVEPSSIQESVTLSLLNQLAGNTDTALELLREATDQNQKLHGKLAANLNRVKTGLKQRQVDDKAWQELTSTISSPEGMNDNVQEISDIIRSLLDNAPPRR